MMPSLLVCLGLIGATAHGLVVRRASAWAQQQNRRVSTTKLDVKFAGDKPSWLEEDSKSFWDDIKTPTVADLAVIEY